MWHAKNCEARLTYRQASLEVGQRHCQGIATVERGSMGGATSMRLSGAKAGFSSLLLQHPGKVSASSSRPLHGNFG